MKRSILLLFILGSNSHVYAQYYGPTEIDLKAAYCLGVKNAQHESFEQHKSKIDADVNLTNEKRQMLLNSWQIQEQNRNRLKDYIISKWSWVSSSTSMLAAVQSGERDVAITKEYGESMARGEDVCVNTCTDHACLKNCWDNAPIPLARVQTCADISWLPY